MNTEKIHNPEVPKVTLTLSDADDLRLFGGLTYIVGLLSSAATLHQNAIYTQTKLINNDISAQKDLNQQLLHVGTVSLTGIVQTEYVNYSVHYVTGNTWHDNDHYTHIVKPKGQVPVHDDLPKPCQGEHAKVCSYHTKNTLQTCKQQTKMNDAIMQGKVLQECRDAIQSRYGQTAKTAEMNNGDVVKFTQDVNQLTSACGSVLDTLTKMTNVMVIPV